MRATQRRGRDILADVGDRGDAGETVVRKAVTFGVECAEFVEDGRRLLPVRVRDALTGARVLHAHEPAHGDERRALGPTSFQASMATTAKRRIRSRG
jgi:hypothetical protein